MHSEGSFWLCGESQQWGGGELEQMVANGGSTEGSLTLRAQSPHSPPPTKKKENSPNRKTLYKLPWPTDSCGASVPSAHCLLCSGSPPVLCELELAGPLFWGLPDSQVPFDLAPSQPPACRPSQPNSSDVLLFLPPITHHSADTIRFISLAALRNGLAECFRLFNQKVSPGEDEGPCLVLLTHFVPSTWSNAKVDSSYLMDVCWRDEWSEPSTQYLSHHNLPWVYGPGGK